MTMAASPAFAQVGAPVPTYFTTTLSGKLSWTLLNEMALADAARSKLARAKASPAATQIFGRPLEFVDVEIVTSEAGPGKPGVALIMLPRFGVQFTAAAKIVIVPAATLLDVTNPEGGLPTAVPPTLLKQRSAKFYGVAIGDANIVAVGYPETPEADAKNRGLTAPAAPVAVPALSDLVLLDLDDNGNVASGKASE